MNSLNNYRQNNFDFLRFIAALLVIATHAVVFTGNGVDLLSFLSKGQIRLGDLAVNTFFVISGYLITASYIRSKKNSQYIYFRILRIIPALFVMLLISAFVIGPIVTDLSYSQYMKSPEVYGFIGSVFLYTLQYELPGVVFTTLNHKYATVVNIALWTLVYEFTFYMLIPIIAKLKALRKEIILLLFIIVFVFYILQPDLYPNAYDVFLLPRFNIASALRLGTMFLVGMVYYFYRDSIKFSSKHAIYALALLVLSCYIGFGYKMLFPLCGGYLIFYFAYSPKFSSLNNFGKHGDFSYGIYIYGAVIQQFILWLFGGEMNNIVNLILTLPIAIICGYLSWNLVEKRFIALKHKKISANIIKETKKAKPNPL